MWKDIEQHFKSSPKRREVASLLLMLGLSCNDELKVFCQDIEVPVKKIADTLGIDRRVITETVRDIMADEKLRGVFSELKPRAFLRDAASALDLGVVEIEAVPETVGIVAGVSSIIASEGLSIRQVVADDPDLFPSPKLTIVTDRKMPPYLLEKILKIHGVRKVSIY
ncbi:amino acid-binding protein [archaeon]|nr:MAG: amino acid-binding protein [archaeon]